MEDFVTYEQALKLKELGFDWKCNYWYYNATKCLVSVYGSDCFDFDNMTKAPTLAQTQKWLRKEHKLWLEPVICITNVNQYSCDIYDLKTADEENYMDGPTASIEGTFNTPEEALVVGIDAAIEKLEEIKQ